MKKISSTLLAIVVFCLQIHAQVDSALRFKTPSISFEQAAALKQASLSSSNDTNEGGDANGFMRWLELANNKRSIAPTNGDDIFTPYSTEIANFIVAPSFYCVESSPIPPDWKCIGPYINYYNGDQYAGRVERVWGNPRSFAHMRAAANSGGLWETRDTGHTWHCITDRVSYGFSTTEIPGTVAIQDMAISDVDTNIIYLNLGMSDASANSYGYRMGLIFSTDGGQNWSFDTSYQHRLAAGPYNGYSALAKMKYKPNTDSIYAYDGLSVLRNNSHSTWEILPSISAACDNHFTDIEFPNTQTNCVLFSGVNADHSVHIFKYTISTGSTSNLLTLSSIFDTLTIDDIIDMSLTSNDTVFLLLAAHANVRHFVLAKIPIFSSSTLTGISLDFHQPAVSVVNGSPQPTKLIVSPNNPTTIYFVCTGWHINVFRTTDGGSTFESNRGSTHDDGRDIILYKPAATLATDGDILLAGTDGGVAIKREGMQYFQSCTGDSLCINQLFGLATYQEDEDLLETGAQDNSGFDLIRRRSNPWETILDGDNYLSEFSRNEKVAYTTSDFPWIRTVSFDPTDIVTSTDDNTLQDGPSPDQPFSPANNWKRPICFDDSNHVNIGYRDAWETDVVGGDWRFSFGRFPGDLITIGDRKIGDIVIADGYNGNFAYLSYRGMGSGDDAMDNAINEKLYYSKKQ